MKTRKVIIELEVLCQDHVNDKALENPVLYYAVPKNTEEDRKEFALSAFGVLIKGKKVSVKGA